MNWNSGILSDFCKIVLVECLLVFFGQELYECVDVESVATEFLVDDDAEIVTNKGFIFLCQFIKSYKSKTAVYVLHAIREWIDCGLILSYRLPPTEKPCGVCQMHVLIIT